jgi:ribosomal 30S subunit maturation factor RimM
MMKKEIEEILENVGVELTSKERATEALESLFNQELNKRLREEKESFVKDLRNVNIYTEGSKNSGIIQGLMHAYIDELTELKEIETKLK